MDKRMRAKGVDLRKHSENTTTPKKTLTSTVHASSSSEKLAKSVSINDLPEAEKQKIAKLAEKVLELNNQVLHLSRHIEKERVQHAEEIKSIHATIEGQISIIEDRLKLKDGAITKLENKEQMITAMLALYQAKLKNMADICRLAGDNEEYNKKKLTQLQADLDHFHIITQNQKKLIESFDETKQQMEERVKSIESRHAKRVKTLEDMISEETDRRLRAEKLSLQQSSENIMLKAEVQQLQYQLQQMRALHTSSLDQEVLVPHLRRAAAASAVAQQPVEVTRPAAVVPPPVVSGTTPTAVSSSLGNHKPATKEEEANPFKKYGPYDEYSLLFNNSQGDESGVQSPVGKAMASPLPTPAATKVPFASDASPSHHIISQAEDLLRRSRNVQLFSNTTEGVHAAAAAAAPPVPPPSMAFPAAVSGSTAHHVAPPPSLPPLKSMDAEPMFTAPQRAPPSQAAPVTRSSSAAVPTVTSAPPPVAPVGAPAFFPRDSRDSLISSVGRPADHVEFDSDEETFGEDDEGDEEDEEDDDEEEEVDNDDDNYEDEGVETAAAAGPPTVATAQQNAHAVHSETTHRRPHGTNQQQAMTTTTTTMEPTASSQSMDLTHTAARSNAEQRDSRRTVTTIEPPPPQTLPANLPTASKPFYPMRPLSASGASSTTRKGEDSAAPVTVTAAATAATTAVAKKKKTKKKVAKEATAVSKKDTTGGIALVSTSYDDSRQGQSPAASKSVLQGQEPSPPAVRVSKVKKVKRSKPSSAVGGAGGREAAPNGASVSFMSHESKDALALLQEKPSLLVSSTESITYLPRPPPRSAQKQQQKPVGVSAAATTIASPPNSSSSSSSSSHHVSNGGQPKKKPNKASSSHHQQNSPMDKPTSSAKVGNNLHYAVPPRLNQPSTIDDHHYHQHKHTTATSFSSRPRSATKMMSSINDKFDASLFDLVDEMERGPSRNASYHYDDDDDDA